MTLCRSSRSETVNLAGSAPPIVACLQVALTAYISRAIYVPEARSRLAGFKVGCSSTLGLMGFPGPAAAKVASIIPLIVLALASALARAQTKGARPARQQASSRRQRALLLVGPDPAQ